MGIEFVDALNRFSAEELRMYGPMAAFGGSGWGKFTWPMDLEGGWEGERWEGRMLEFGE